MPTCTTYLGKRCTYAEETGKLRENSGVWAVRWAQRKAATKAGMMVAMTAALKAARKAVKMECTGTHLYRI